MAQRGKMCPHLGSQHVLEIKKLEKVKSCSDCDYEGPNLWVCLQRNCLRVGCSEQASDHSTEHFRRNNSHCLHLNMSSQRLWCYLCEREVFIEAQPALLQDPFRSALHSVVALSKEDADFDAVTGSATGLVGLQNIANTCYMNSALQALSNLQPMTHYFLNCSDLVEYIVEQGSHRSKVGLAKSYQRLVHDIWRNDNGRDYIAPRGILYGIRSVHPMFRGFQQHDTQEFLRCFMDQLHEELKELSPTMTVAMGAKQQCEELASPTKAGSASQSSSASESEYETCDSSVSQRSSPLAGQGQLRAGGSDRGRRFRKSVHMGSAQPQAVAHSIISDVFDGKLLSSVQCLTCDRVSTREETFQDLSLPIPNRDHLNMLHQTHGLSAQSLSSIDTLEGSGGDGWLAWFLKLFRLWLWGPSVTLHDCMASFFSADELKGDNMYSCEKCNKLRTGVKYSQILDLPEVLCIHLKRFRHDLSYSSKISSPVHFPLEGFDMRPYLHKDCKSQVTLYNLVSVICHHGTVGGGHYTCFARNALSGRWHQYDDQYVSEVSASAVQTCQAYVLFYRKHNPQMDLLRAEASEISALNPVHTAEIRFYIAREWLSRFSTFAEPGPINNWTILCPHGGLLQSKSALLEQIAVPISQPLWDFLYRKFGGGPAVNMLFECEVCKRAAEALTRRQYYELSVFTKYNGIDADFDSSAIYAISMPWLRKWQQFAHGVTHKEPGPITNTDIVSKDAVQTSAPMRQVRPGSDYAQLNAILWRFLVGIYGGGPEIMLRDSVAEEIEIVDQDDHNCADNFLASIDLSDTESNIGNVNTLSSNESRPSQDTKILDNMLFEGGHKSKPLRIPYGSGKESRLVKYYSGGSKRPKPPSLRNTLRKKSIRGRSGMKGVDFFGPKGNYSLRKNCDGIENASNQPNQMIDTHSGDDVESKLSAFKKGQKHSFHGGERKRRSHSKNSFADSTDAQLAENCIPRMHGGHIKSKLKNRDGVTLQKFVQLPESSESTETDI